MSREEAFLLVGALLAYPAFLVFVELLVYFGGGK